MGCLIVAIVALILLGMYGSFVLAGLGYLIAIVAVVVGLLVGVLALVGWLAR